ncbi:Motility accessory factor [Desulfitobacterium hafniense]|uniref:Motility accessory factor n=1 Tax=Desulfitobacterium hafniense TaxID=49338 RepID=A0A098B2R6_DESHA|nr:6-hydroxymethylpterin diphosphokinase MptE-like protein [Desulfitobacterium hafniense]CDX03138.1 Motility accessory factor [Desulfitobacterium hafniense]
MSRFDKNIEMINRRNIQDFITEMDDRKAPFNYVGTDMDGVKVFCGNDGKPFIIEPKVDEEHLPNPYLKQMIFFFGIGSLLEIHNVAKSAHRDSLFVIIEPNPYFLQNALNHEDFKLLNEINYIIVTQKADDLTELLQLLFTTKFFNLIRNVIFYINYYYRNYDSSSVKTYVLRISAAIKNRFFSIGNSVHDSLIGLVNNLKNIKHLSHTPDVAGIKNAFDGVPAFIVAAGPSLDKNIEQLKRIQGKGIILAVDTIVQKLLDNGIIPDFICTVERGEIVWEYFYRGKEYPSNLYLVSSLVADSRIVEAFKNRSILPMRQGVREYFWLRDLLGLTQEHFIWMGASSAHIAVGLALHLGASPIVLVGQDLAYGKNGTHANGTIYDENPIKRDENSILIPGYSDEYVQSSEIWVEFKVLFEAMFVKMDRLIINSTEGGAKIIGTIQRPLSEVVSEYCHKECNVFKIMQSSLKHSIDWISVEDRICKYIEKSEKYRKKIKKHLDNLNEIRRDWDDSMTEKEVQGIYKIMKNTDEFYRAIAKDELLYHNIQGPLAIIVQKFQAIEDVDSLSNLKDNLEVQIELCRLVENSMWLIIQVIKENYPWSIPAKKGS